MTPIERRVWQQIAARKWDFVPESDEPAVLAEYREIFRYLEDLRRSGYFEGPVLSSGMHSDSRPVKATIAHLTDRGEEALRRFKESGEI